jgi:hypothetical protein
MIIKRINYKQFMEWQQREDRDYQLLESQPYGTEDERFYILAVTKAFHDKTPDADVIADKGRTSGLCQNLGASGVLHPEVAAIIMTPNAARIVERMPNGRIFIEGETWAEILTNATEVAKIDFSDFTNAQVKKTRKS